MKKKRRKFYQKGLESWLDIVLDLNMATDEQCPVCNENKCKQYAQSIFKHSKLADDCPLRNNPMLCKQLRVLKQEISDIYYKVLNTIDQIKGLHAKEGILHEG